ncbi:AlpA family phage regulatory protein [Desulfovibrio piger]|uniref:helix-turn-helix transcriptional regulator n=1 Tax=Desulfovibrio piger TaxID=901 RepID=UPI00307EBFF2
MKNNVTLDEPCFLRLHAVLRIMGLSRSAWYAGIKEGRFPQSVQLTKRAVGWRASDIQTLVSRLNSGKEA